MGKITPLSRRGNKRLCSLLIILMVILVSFSISSIDCNNCPSLIKTYYECSFLTMTNSSGDFTPDGSIPGNSLNDTFFRSKKLDTLTLEKAMQLYGQIYKESNCKTYKCDCIRSQILTSDADYSLYFNSAGALNGLKKVIEDLNKDKSLIKKAQTDVEFIYSDYGPALAKFCSKFEFNSIRMTDFYTNWGDCTTSYSEDVNNNNNKN